LEVQYNKEQCQMETTRRPTLCLEREALSLIKYKKLTFLDMT